MKSGWRALYAPRETEESALRPLRRAVGVVLFAVGGGFGVGYRQRRVDKCLRPSMGRRCRFNPMYQSRACRCSQSIPGL